MRFFSVIPIAFVVCGPWAVIPATGQEPIWSAPAAGVSGEWPSGDCPSLPLMEITVHEAIACDDPNQTEPLPGFASQFGMMQQVDQSNDFMQPFDDSIAQLPPFFVHDRRTVRISDRIAEIWVKLPNDAQCSVSVNFVEYPPEGNFRIFRTKLTTKEPRRFYLSARRWDVKANHWVDLVAAPSLLNDGIPNLDYVDLRPGATEVIQFDNPQPPIVTKAFRFKPEEQEIVGTATRNDGHVTSVNWKKHPAILNISMTATALRLSALPDRAFTARITFTVHDSADRIVATLKPILVTFKNGKDTVEGEINFDSMIDGPLQNALSSHAASTGTYHLKASMSFAKDMGDVLGYQTITGDLGNDIELNINP